MERLKQYSVALIAAVLTLVFLIMGVLSLTVLKPAKELSSSTVSTNTILMTRDGVLPLVDTTVVVRARSKSGASVALGVGTPGDVLGWIGDDPYTEVVGITSDRSVLKIQEHDALRGEGPDLQSGAQSGAEKPQSASVLGAQSGTQSGADSSQSSATSEVSGPHSQLVEELGASDMWLVSAKGEGTATVSLSDIPAKRSLIAASAGEAGDLELTLTWPTLRVNTLAIVSFLCALVSFLIAGVAWLSRRQLLRHRHERATRLAQQATADLTHTEVIDSARIAELVGDEHEDEGAAPDEGQHVDDAEPLQTPTHAEGEVDHPEGVEEISAQALAGVEDSGAAVKGRHGLAGTSLDEDPPETVPTDTGVIDLSSIRPGAALPSRRALREAREKGEAKIVVEGREFDTGLIPVVANDDEATSNDDDDTAQGQHDTGSWTSLMSGWLRSSHHHGEDPS